MKERRELVLECVEGAGVVEMLVGQCVDFEEGDGEVVGECEGGLSGFRSGWNYGKEYRFWLFYSLFCLRWVRI